MAVFGCWELCNCKLSKLKSLDPSLLFSTPLFLFLRCSRRDQFWELLTAIVPDELFWATGEQFDHGPLDFFFFFFVIKHFRLCIIKFWKDETWVALMKLPKNSALIKIFRKMVQKMQLKRDIKSRMRQKLCIFCLQKI